MGLLLCTISIVLFFSSFYFYTNAYISNVNKLVFILFSLCSIFLFTLYISADYFTGDGVSYAALYHIQYGLGGAGFLEYLWPISGVLIVLLASVISVFYFVKYNNVKFNTNNISNIMPNIILLVSILINPALVNLNDLLLVSAQKNNQNHLETNNQNYLEVNNEFYEYYKEPKISGGLNNKKNIVYIYLESLERTYFDENIFPGLINGLKQLEKISINFTNVLQVRGTGWTIAGITASQCGIPLVTPSHGNSMSGMDHFLPKAICLGDILKANDYGLYYLAGANINFAGKGKFLRTHGFDEVQGESELLPLLLDSNYKSNWGLYDDSLLNILYDRFIELSSQNESFALFSLTLDTHHPAGHKSKSCEEVKYGNGGNPILNSVACSDLLVTKFVKRILNSSYATNTVIVLSSDHLALRNTATKLLEKGRRKNLFLIIDPSQQPNKIDKLASMLDIAPTLLSVLGNGNDLGLGRNLFEKQDLSEQVKYIHSNLVSWENPISKFWDFPKLKQNLEIKLQENLVFIDNRAIKFPVMIELNDKLQTVLKFQFDGHSSHLIKHRMDLEINDYFLMIDKCKNARKIDRSLGSEGYCLLGGKGEKNTIVKKLENDINYSVDEIRSFLGMPSQFIVKRIAHASGGIDGETYTNSIDALDVNLNDGFEYFEIDFSYTKDGKLVCLHDWEESFKRSFGFETSEKVTLEDFNNLVSTKSKYKKCTENSLASWMMKNPKAKIVSDVKERNLEALKNLMDVLPDAKIRVIPQIYEPSNYKDVQDMGFENIIWTLYRYRKSNKQVLKWVDSFDGNIAITMPIDRAKSSLPKKLRAKGVPTYVHTINSNEQVNNYLNKYQISEIYTDFLLP